MSLAEVLAKHQRNEWGQHDGWWECECSGDVPWSVEHQAEAVAAAGLAVIQLPEPDRENPRVWRGSFGGMSCYVTKSGAVGTPDGPISVAEARADATALLAAAAAAEQVSS